MNIKWHTDYALNEQRNASERIPAPIWPEGWPVPRVGDHVFINWMTIR